MNARTLLNRARTSMGSDTAYLTPESVDLDVSQAYSVQRRRVLFEDVTLVALHQERGAPYLISTAVMGIVPTAIAIFIVSLSVEAWPWALPFFLVGLTCVILFLVRLAMGRSVVTVLGRRSRAVLRFGTFRTGRAREAYGQICAAVRRAQSGFVNAPGSPAPPLPAEVPLPPPAQ
ncbi:MAG TPA: hypothetical protein VND45_02315 [Thermoanaerobaculia bacterium]|nr:hypothetical protein [Thermoanaerobaculia bacterium]